MEKEEVALPIEMGKLEIEPIKRGILFNDKNPFGTITHNPTSASKCSCPHLNKVKKKVVYTKRRNRLLKEPTLKVLQSKLKYIVINNNECKRENNNLDSTYNCGCSVSNNNNMDNIYLNLLVDNCSQLKISSETRKVCSVNCGKNNWLKREAPNKEDKVSGEKNLTSPSCSQQALNPPCDITIDELASYFETLVHIPKKMSSMAEMMYI